MNRDVRRLSIAEIVVKDRVRRDLGDIPALMRSLEARGQLNPVIVNASLELIAGHRRLDAARRLGWASVDAVVVSGLNDVQELEMELDENVYRKDFSAEEIIEGYRKLDRLRRPNLFRRIGRFFHGLFGWLFGRRRPAGRPTAPSGVRDPLFVDPERARPVDGEYGV